MAINTENGPITPRGILPGEIDPEGGSDGEQLDASLTVFSDKDNYQVRDGRGSWMLISLTGGMKKRTATLLPLMRHDIYPVADPCTGFWTRLEHGIGCRKNCA